MQSSLELPLYPYAQREQHPIEDPHHSTRHLILHLSCNLPSATSSSTFQSLHPNLRPAMPGSPVLPICILDLELELQPYTGSNRTMHHSNRARTVIPPSRYKSHGPRPRTLRIIYHTNTR